MNKKNNPAGELAKSKSNPSEANAPVTGAADADKAAEGSDAGDDASGEHPNDAPNQALEEPAENEPKTPFLQFAKELAQKMLETMNRMKVNVLYLNKKDEIFTSESLAHLSENGKKENVLTITREALELVIIK